VTGDLGGRYKELYIECLVDIAPALENHLREVLKGVSHIDRISVRPKEPDRFLAKAEKELDGGAKKYADPINEIQDQIGGRVVVFYAFDVDAVKDEILKYLMPIELTVKEPSGDSEFGYFGEHFILRIPDDVIPEKVHIDCPKFFELQIKTVFQHAWSEANHDLGYKSVRELSRQEKRQVAFTAAQAWGADLVFRELAEKLVLGEGITPKADNED
jgi:putative GTP pyrophosphokinase